MNSANLNSSFPPSGESKSRRKVMVITSVTAILVIAICIAVCPFVFMSAKAETVVRIPRSGTEQQLSDTLKKYFGDGYASKVMTVVRTLGTDIPGRHGAYTIDEGMSALKAGRLLSRGEQTPVKLTINGFRSDSLLASRIARKMTFSSAELEKAMRDSATLAKYGLTPGQSLALFLDDTYHVYWDASPSEVISKIGDHYLSVWNKERRAKAQSLGITPAEALIICSIADEETLKDDEKGVITRLYLNRLKKGMKLQADPTVRYALNDFTIKRVTTPMLSTDSPYNTYRNAGLPPGPIRTTSVKTLDALLDSKPHDYYYMCAKEDFSGYHNFATTYTEHQENARRYQNKLNELGIK